MDNLRAHSLCLFNDVSYSLPWVYLYADCFIRKAFAWYRVIQITSPASWYRNR